MNDIIFPGSLWAIFQRSGCSLEAASVARTIHFSAGAAEGVGAAPNILLVLPPHIWTTSPKAAPPPTLFNLRSERLSQRLYASSHLPFGKHCSRRPPTSDCCSLKPEASEPFDSLHLFAKLRKPPLAASDVHLSLPD